MHFALNIPRKFNYFQIVPESVLLQSLYAYCDCDKNCLRKCLKSFNKKPINKI